MGEPSDLDYPFYQTLFEALDEASQQIELAKEAEGTARLCMRLKMASRALRCALEIYGDYVAGIQKEMK